MPLVRGSSVLWGMGALVSMLWACETTRNPGGIQRDVVPPTIKLKASADTQDIAGGLNFSVTATDNLGLKDIRLTYTGGYINTTDTVFTSAVTNLTVGEKVNPGSGAGGLITIVGRATDGAGNFAEDTIRVFLVNVDALRVYLVQPAAGAVASQGKYIPVSVAAHQKSGVKRIGWLVTGSTGFFTIAGFAVDSGNRVGQTSPITVTILSVANDNTPPQIEQFLTLRSEANDTITVHATDPSGITVIGFAVTSTTGAPIRRDSVLLSGSSTDALKRFALGLNTLAPLPQQVVIQAFACDGAVAHNCGVTGGTFTIPSPTGPSRADTVTIVAATTKTLPFGGRIVAATYP